MEIQEYESIFSNGLKNEKQWKAIFSSILEKYCYAFLVFFLSILVVLLEIQNQYPNP